MKRRHFLASVPLALLYVRTGQALAQVPAAAGLRPLADKKSFRFGSAIDLQNIDDPIASEIYIDNVNSITPRNELKWNATEKRPGVFSFGSADRMVAFARKNNMRVYGHTLIWYRVPGWVSDITDAKTIQAAMNRHIKQVVTRYKNSIDAWDVVNEPLEYDAPDLRDCVFRRLLGDDYIRMSFDMAHQANPGATLVLNETHLEKKSDVFEQKRARILKIVEDLVAKKTPINAVGLQAHFRPGLDRIDPEGMGRFCAALKDMGVGVFITELDASCHFLNRDKAFTPASYADIFSDVITVAAEHGDLKGVTVWGMSEKYGERDEKAADPAAACTKRVNLYDENNAPRSAIDGVRRAIEAM
ncbi:endo-1,4-beta-xylanase [Rhizobium ruizarguesonis]|uniref:Beta-xylanase n=1 Tax=Rhizobium ruizarguesonis TaxID=2081791 RepID=A0AAE5C1I0_9HYPH|nr:endo-1,4-beta-xylanase [Rhizobium ruizarguesonis]MBY5880626.1 endo-1,4-beta-xylanase [Rhizobium leguminosarum]NKL40709.1 1,4-beta-xylanase [Rhizobium leguminosarum bv. viciae]MBY5895426.1 endo-1,4-beta-xylanase [Rhizobium leguminosarum]MCB2399895.1 endo-1,4-beta-xylanase [Rhizobium ruizarguesonis]NEH35040.1 1,4-beta-xylanase [Rhizobium ruizarguesonis]